MPGQREALARVDEPVALDAQDRHVLVDVVADVEIAPVVAEDGAFGQAADLDFVRLVTFLPSIFSATTLPFLL
jgi:hypothetical protein